MNLLLVEDERKLSALLKQLLEDERSMRAGVLDHPGVHPRLDPGARPGLAADVHSPRLQIREY